MVPRPLFFLGLDSNSLIQMLFAFHSIATTRECFMHVAEGQNSSPRQTPFFCTTQWTVVLTAGKDGPDSLQALERLCETYWYPLYSFARRKGRSPEDAQDLVQGFFASLLAGNRFSAVASAKGKFRTFLLTSFSNYMANEWDRANTIKRGRDIAFVSIHADEAEGKYRSEPADHTTPENLFERAWAETVVDAVVTRLKDEYTRAGEASRFDVLKEFLMGTSDERYSAVGASLGLSEGGVKTCVRRLRLRFRDLLRQELSQTVEDASEIDEEIRRLLLALAG